MGPVSGVLVVPLYHVTWEHCSIPPPPVTPMSSFHTGEGLMMGNEGVVGARRPLRRREGSGHYISCVRTGGGAGSRSGGRGRRNILAWESLFFHLCWWRMLFSKELVVLGGHQPQRRLLANSPGGRVLWCSRSGRRCREQPRWSRFPSSRFPVPPPQSQGPSGPPPSHLTIFRVRLCKFGEAVRHL